MKESEHKERGARVRDENYLDNALVGRINETVASNIDKETEVMKKVSPDKARHFEHPSECSQETDIEAEGL